MCITSNIYIFHDIKREIIYTITQHFQKEKDISISNIFPNHDSEIYLPHWKYVCCCFKVWHPMYNHFEEKILSTISPYLNYCIKKNKNMCSVNALFKLNYGKQLTDSDSDYDHKNEINMITNNKIIITNSTINLSHHSCYIKQIERLTFKL